MAGFRGGDGDAHRFRVAHFAYDENIRRLTQSRAEGCRKIGGVRTDFDLFDDASNVGVLVLDGIFDGDDVARLAAVDVVDQRGERGRFSGTSWTADEYKAAREMREGFD